MENPVSIRDDVMHGIPCFAGTRVPIRAMFDLLSHDRTLQEFLDQYPSVTRAQALAVLKSGERYASESAA